MGLDFVDMNLRLKDRLGFEIPLETWEEKTTGRKRFDVTAGEVLELVEQRRDAIRRARSRATPLDGAGVVLDYRSDQDEKLGPEADLWFEVRDVIAATLRIEAEDVRRDCRLVRDLGMT